MISLYNPLAINNDMSENEQVTFAKESENFRDTQIVKQEHLTDPPRQQLMRLFKQYETMKNEGYKVSFDAYLYIWGHVKKCEVCGK